MNDTVSVFGVGFITVKSYSITKSKSNKDLLEIYVMVRHFRSRLAWPGKRVTIRLRLVSGATEVAPGIERRELGSEEETDYATTE